MEATRTSEGEGISEGKRGGGGSSRGRKTKRLHLGHGDGRRKKDRKMGGPSKEERTSRRMRMGG